MTVKEKISALREIMDREGLDAYIISGTDPHNSEYLPEAWQQRQWISGFAGSFGTVVVTKEDAGLWTDTRYFIQADKELKDSGIKMHKLRVPDAVDYPEWLSMVLLRDAKVGIDSFCMSVSDVRHLKECLALKNISVVGKTDLLGEIWLDRPALPASPVFVLDVKYAGITAAEKIRDIRKELEANQADYIVFSSLDEIAWLYNIRGNDIPYNPLAVSYAVIGRQNAWLFIKSVKITGETGKILAETGVEIRDYHHLFLFLDEIEEKSRFWVDSNTLNYAIYNKVNSRFTVVEKNSPVILKKAVKNPVEIEGFRKACVQDGVAMTKFFYWLEKQIGKESLSETKVAEKLGELRAAGKDYLTDSFHTISAYGPNAALPHYSAIPGKDSLLEPKGLYLVDSGGQYWCGTTDITRTVALGPLTIQEKEDFTLVLKGMIALSRCIFPKGTSGGNIDIVARQPLWQKMRNYGHGTGHGIGHLLCVHEGPQDIRQNLKNQPLLSGMVTSDEPGIYREGFHGIRHENMIVCISAGSNEFGDWNSFETLTLCYFDTSALLPELLDQEEKEWLNLYHRVVFERISPYLSPEESGWLKSKTKEI